MNERMGVAVGALLALLAACSGRLGSNPEHYEGHEEYKKVQADYAAEVREAGTAMASDFFFSSVYVRDHRTTPPTCYLFGRYADHPHRQGGRSTAIADVDCARVEHLIALEFGK